VPGAVGRYSAATYQERLAAADLARYDGKVLLRFPRLFMVAMWQATIGSATAAGALR